MKTTIKYEKQTKAEFCRQATENGIRFHGAVWRKSLEECFEKLHEIIHPEKAALCKVEKYGDGIRREKVVDGESKWSYTDLRKETSVYKSGKFWILFSDYGDNTCAVAYSIMI